MFGILAQATQPVVTEVEILEKVSSFFYTAWGMLLAMVVLVAGVVGWVVPWWISRAQKLSFELKEKELLDRIETQREEAERQIAQLDQRLTQKMDEELAEAKGDAFFAQGVVLQEMKGYRPVGLQLAVLAAGNYVRAAEEQKGKVGVSLKGAIKACQGHEDELGNTSESTLDMLNILAADLKAHGLEPRFGDMVEQFRKLLEKAGEDTKKASGESGGGTE